LVKRMLKKVRSFPFSREIKNGDNM
jgi:hypothetical protein